MAMTRFLPRMIRAGSGNQVLSTGRCLVAGAVLTTKAQAASLSLHNLGTGAGLSGTSTRLIFLASRASGSATLPGTVLEFGTGLTVSCSGPGAVATVFVSTRR